MTSSTNDRVAKRSHSNATKTSDDVMSKPARLQVDPESLPDDKPPQNGTVFNIWYLRWSGGGDSSKNSYVKSKFKANIAKDSGYTKAKNNGPICLFFARGCCYLGKNCNYLHRLPRDTDNFIPTQDCFGRDKTAEYREDMDGVGSFNKFNRTLYIGGLHMNNKLETTITRAFSEFGSIEKIRVLHSKSCAFITYRLEAEAQFAKEAMQNQSLDGNDVLNIRWANDDPNPQAQEQEKKRMEEIALDTVKNLLDTYEQRPKRAKYTVEEPEDSEPVTNELVTQAQIEYPKDENKIVFDASSLKSLSKIELPKKNISSVLGDYSSDEE